MKFFYSFLISLIIHSGCNQSMNDNQPDKTGQNINSGSDQLCFQRLEGASNQDTTTVKLIVDSSSVSGELNYIPFEKDSRKGEIKGNREGNIIKAVWSFMQEGFADSLNVEFRLDNGRLLQKEFSVDPQTGRQYLRDTSRYVLEFTKVDCRTF